MNLLSRTQRNRQLLNHQGKVVALRNIELRRHGPALEVEFHTGDLPDVMTWRID